MSRSTIILAGLASLTLLAASTGCQSTKTTADSSDIDAYEYENWGQTHQFTYFPASMVYLDQQVGTWFWFEDGVWQSGQELPESMTINPKNAIALQCDPDQPWIGTSETIETTETDESIKTIKTPAVKPQPKVVSGFRGVWVSTTDQP